MIDERSRRVVDHIVPGKPEQNPEEKLGSIKKKVVCFIGDGACNVPRSWIFAAAKLGFELRIAAPRKYQPTPALLKRAGGKIVVTEDRAKAAAGGAVDALRAALA